jgi:F-type H+-transporting ATPase subunit b
MPQFDVSTFSSQLFWLVLVFGFLYIVVSKVIAPKAEAILMSRNRYLEDNITASENYNDEARSLRQLKEEKIHELNVEAEEIRKTALDKMEAYFVKEREKVSLTLHKKTQESMLEIQKYVDSFHTKETQPSVDLASFIIEHITDRPADLKLLGKIHQKKGAK